MSSTTVDRTHVIVVGGGLAGLTAAITAADNGALVTILEKEKSVGGNSAKATSGMNGCGTKAQDAAGVLDTESLFFADTISSGHGKSDPALVRTLAAQSKSAVDFICSHGVDLAAVTLCGGHSVSRTHHEAPRADGKPTPVGWDIISALKKVVESRPADFILRTGTRVLDLLRSPTAGGPLGAAAVIGVKIQVAAAAASTGAATAVTEHEEEILADAVILCTGGFGNDHTKDSLLAEFAPHLACLPTTNGPFAQGDGVKLARSAGAYLRGMQEVQVHPTGFIDPADVMNRTKFLGPEALRGVGGILFNHHGKRFVNELGRRDDVSRAMYRYCSTVEGGPSQEDEGLPPSAQPKPAQAVGFIVLSQASASAFGPNLNFYWKVKKFFKQVVGVEQLAVEMGAPADVVRGELASYAAAAVSGCDAFGKTAFPDSFAGSDAPEAVFYIARVTPSIHYTMGGAATNAAAELLYADTVEVDAAKAAGMASTTQIVDKLAEFAASAEAMRNNVAAELDISARIASGDHAAAHFAAEREVGPLISDTVFEQPILRPIPNLFGAGEVTGGLHGGNRLAGNSLLECVVFGRIAGARAAAAKSAVVALNSETFTPLVVRESIKVCTNVFLFRFNLPSPSHVTGLAVGQYIAVRATIDGKETVRFYSPISRPEDRGHIDLLLKVDPVGGQMTSYVNELQPGQSLEFKGPLGGPMLDFSPSGNLGRIKRIGLLCGGTGVAPMVQILRSALYHKRDDVPIKMLYAAATPDQLAFLPTLKRKAELHKNFEMFNAVDKVPAGMSWDGHVGFVTPELVAAHMFPPSDDLLIVICGPYPMCQALKNKVLPAAGYTPEMYFCYM